MWAKVWHKINNTVLGGAFLIAFFSFLSKIFGLVRERLIASTFGAGQLSDVYYTAFRLPDLIFNTLVLGALTSAFIPVFQKAWTSSQKDGLTLANSVLNFFLLFVGLLTAIAIYFAPDLMPLIAPGFEDWQLVEATRLTRVMLLAIIFFVASNVIGGVLNSWKKFFSFSLAASFYNIGIIIGIVYFYKTFGLIGLSYGVLLGSIFHLIVQLPEAYKNGYRYQGTIYFDEKLKRILKLMVPRTLGLAAAQVNLLAINIIASTLAVGSIAVFNLANNLQSLPVSIFAVSLAIAVFPTFTQAISENNQIKFSQNFSISFRRLLFVLIPISIMILVLRAQIVRVTLGAGQFSWEDTYYTAQTLGFFAVSIFAQGLIPLLARSFYAFEDTKTPMMVSLFTITINIVLSWFLARVMGVMGLGLAFSISSLLNMALLYILLHSRVPDLSEGKIYYSIVRISGIAVAAGFITHLVLQYMARVVDMQTFLGIFTQGLVAGLTGLIVYLILAIVLRMDEVHIIKRMISRFGRLFKNGKA